MLDLFDTGWDWVGLGKFTVPGLGLGKFLENGNWNGVLGYCTGPGLDFSHLNSLKKGFALKCLQGAGSDTFIIQMEIPSHSGVLAGITQNYETKPLFTPSGA